MCVRDSGIHLFYLLNIPAPFFLIIPHIILFAFIHPSLPLHVIFFSLSPPSGLFLPSNPPTLPLAPQPCLLQQSLSCDKDGTCSRSSSCYASRSAALIFWHWSPSNCQQQTGTEGGGWVEVLGEASVFFLINNFHSTETMSWSRIYY